MASLNDRFNLPLRINDGALTVPKGPGVGIAEPREILKEAEVVKGYEKKS